MSIRSACFSSCAVLSLAFTLVACGDSTTGPAQNTPPPPDYTGCDTIIEASANDQEKVQEALINAAAGSTVCLGRGTFKFDTEVSIANAGLTLRGQGKDATILDFSGQTVGGNGMQITSDDVTVEGFAVKNTPGDGIRATSVKNILFHNVAVIWDADASLKNGAYGLYPVGSEGVTIDGCVVKGARDAGVYVGQSSRVLLVNNEAYGNVAGYELENTIEAEAYGNLAHNNTAGFLIFSLPDLPVQNGGIGHSYVHDNVFENNDEPNFAVPGSMVALVPKGCGMVLLATDQNEIALNKIVDNDTTGVLILSYTEKFIGTSKDPNFDEYPESNYIHDNTFDKNGLLPDGKMGAIVVKKPIPDVVTDGCVDAMKMNTNNSLTNCLKNNGSGTFTDIGVCNGFMQTTDIAPVTCEQPAVKPLAP
ncbi:MAG TPA: parallel beta-helix domain-containing protein [Polyangium sp.]|nr:parallel beta-helix domain-containing protein [Polyangium sp.]